MSVDTEAIRTRLAEYDPDATRCTKTVAENRNYAPDSMDRNDPEWDTYTVTHYVPCCRPEGHEGECRNSRRVMGWPGRATLIALLDEVESLRKEVRQKRSRAELDDLLARVEQGAVLSALGLHEDTPHDKVLVHVRALVAEHAEMRMVMEGHRHRFNKENS